MNDPYDLSRFITAQDPLIKRVIDELTAGQKQSHWMWFVFPQISGLGSSAMAKHYAMDSLAEAQAYIEHSLLRSRLRQCTTLVNKVEGRSARAIFGQPDDMKFRSCMTLFSRTADQNDIFVKALNLYFGGEPDPETLSRLR